MSDYHPNIDGPAEPYGLSIDGDGNPLSPPATGSAGDMTEDPEYLAWVERMAKHCRCRSSDVPCAGVLAGGLCDEIDDGADRWDHDDNEL